MTAMLTYMLTYAETHVLLNMYKIARMHVQHSKWAPFFRVFLFCIFQPTKQIQGALSISFYSCYFCPAICQQKAMLLWTGHLTCQKKKHPKKKMRKYL